MSCSENSLLKGIKDKQAQLDSLLEGGKAQLSSMSSKLNELKADLNSFKPELPNIGGLQKELLDLAALTTPEGLAAKIAELNEKYGTKVPNLSSLISSLGLDSFPPSINTSDICDQIPNVEEKPDGTIKEEPKESKPAEEKPPEPTPEKKTAPKPVIEPDKDELNLKVIKNAIGLARGQIRTKTDVLDVSAYLRERYFELTENELYIQLSELGGSTFDELRWRHYDLAEHQKTKADFLNTYVYFAFRSEGQILQLKYTEAKEALGPEYSDADDINAAAKLLVKQRKERIA